MLEMRNNMRNSWFWKNTFYQVYMDRACLKLAMADNTAIHKLSTLFTTARFLSGRIGIKYLVQHFMPLQPPDEIRLVLSADQGLNG